MRAAEPVRWPEPRKRPKGGRPLRGVRTRGLAPFVGAGEGGFRPEPATEGVQIPCPLYCVILACERVLFL